MQVQLALAVATEPVLALVFSVVMNGLMVFRDVGILSKHYYYSDCQLREPDPRDNAINLHVNARKGCKF